MDYGKIITRAWEVFWRHKILWVFGILSGLTGGIYNIYAATRPSTTIEAFPDYYPGQIPWENTYLDVVRWAMENMVLFVSGIILVVLVLMLVSMLVTALSASAIIQGNLLDAIGTDPLTFKGLVDAIRPFYWRVFLLNLLLGVGGMGLVFALLAILFVLAVFTMGLGVLCFSPLLLLLAPVVWFLSIVVTQATIAIIAEDLGVKDALVRAWHLVTGRLGPFLLVWLIMFVFSLLIGLVIYIPSFIAMFPVIGILFSSGYLEDPALLYQQLSAGFAWRTILSAVQVLLLSIYGVFQTSVWVQTYLEAREDGTLETPDQPDQAGSQPDRLEQTNK